MRLPFFLASRFVAGETLKDTLPVVRGLNDDGLRVALDLLGEHVTDRNVAERATDTYVDLVRTIADDRYDVNISIKLSMMGQQIDEDFCAENLRRLLEVARSRDVFVRLDMEGSDTTASTLRLFERVYPDYPDHVGPVLQAMLHRTERDVERMCELGASVRICKGAYDEPSSLAAQDMSTIRERFAAHMRRLLADAGHTGVATHDDGLIAAAQSFAREHDLGAGDFEFQMLYGMRPETQRAMAAKGHPMRVYVPYGTEWLPYYTRRLTERKENIWFVLKNLFRR